MSKEKPLYSCGYTFAVKGHICTIKNVNMEKGVYTFVVGEDASVEGSEFDLEIDEFDAVGLEPILVAKPNIEEEPLCYGLPDVKTELCDIFKAMDIVRPVFSSEAYPIEFEGGSFYYSERNTDGNRRKLSISTEEGMCFGVTMPSLFSDLEFCACYKDGYNDTFEQACAKYGYDKAFSLLMRVKLTIASFMPQEDKEPKK